MIDTLMGQLQGLQQGGDASAEALEAARAFVQAMQEQDARSEAESETLTMSTCR